ncbi:MAG: NUDIX hydrolase [Thermoproteota archaeon]|nr:NUDIX hydrolase [Thermoproteota archaeon]
MSKEIKQQKHKNPVPAVDFLVSKDNSSKILLVRRKNDPFKGMLSIPGGFINEGETAEQSMRREAKEETSIVLELVAILGVYSDPSRDPRMHTISVTFIAKIVIGHEAAKDDAAAVEWVNVEDEIDRLIETNQIAFDHPKILTDFKQWRKATQVMSQKNNNIPTFWSTKNREAGTEEIFQVKPSDS